MRRTLLTASVALALGLCAQSSQAALPAGISGSWFNPAQPGHGLSIELLDGDSALAYWYVYDRAGNPLHLYIEGAVQDDSIVGTAYMGRGMRFGEFDPTDHTLAVWGQVAIEFADCDSATLEWNANGAAGAGFGVGSIPLNRLTHIAGLGCEDLDGGPDPDGVPPAGKYSGMLLYPDGSPAGSISAAVDSMGRLWATPAFTPTSPYVGPVSLVFASDAPTAAGALQIGVHGNYALTNSWYAELGLLDVVPVTFDGSLRGVADVQDSTRGFDFRPVDAAVDPLARTITAADLAGLSFEFEARQQFFPVDHYVRFFEGGEFCLDTGFEDCYLHGTYVAEDPGLSMVSFTGEIEGTTYRGKAWVEFDADGNPGQLVMVGVGQTPGPMAHVGLGLVARPAL